MSGQARAEAGGAAALSALIRTSAELRSYAATEPREAVADDEFRDTFSRLLDRMPQGLVRGFAFASLPARLPTWLDSGTDCRAGEAVSVFSALQAMPSTEEGQIPPDRRLWHRVGQDGDAQRGARSSHTFVPTRSGRLLLAAGPLPDPVVMSDNPLESYSFTRPRADRCALVVRWAVEPLEGLEALRALGDVGGHLDSEIARLQATIELPDGWHYPSDRGPWEQFVADTRAGGSTVIGCYSHDNAALLRKSAVLPFRPGTKLCWEWKVGHLPVRKREDRLETHDYLSIAVEFDNGRDLTYHWSAELPVDAGYHCPVPGWTQRETHVVVRSGTNGLGEWVDEERDLYRDYAHHVGDPPNGIVGVWLLAVTYLQHGDGQCDYRRIELVNRSTRLRVN